MAPPNPSDLDSSMERSRTLDSSRPQKQRMVHRTPTNQHIRNLGSDLLFCEEKEINFNSGVDFSNLRKFQPRGQTKKAPDLSRAFSLIH